MKLQKKKKKISESSSLLKISACKIIVYGQRCLKIRSGAVRVDDRHVCLSKMTHILMTQLPPSIQCVCLRLSNPHWQESSSSVSLFQTQTQRGRNEERGNTGVTED